MSKSSYKNHESETGILLHRHPAFAGMAFDIYIRHTDHRLGKVSFAENLQFTQYDMNSSPALEPLLQISEKEAQALMDDLWKFGVRPTDDFSGTTEKALKDHINSLKGVVSSQERIIHGLIGIDKRIEDITKPIAAADPF